MKNKKIIFITLLCLCMLFSSCQKNNNHINVPNDENAINIGVLIYRYDDAFIETVRLEMINHSEKISVEKNVRLNIEMVDANNQQEIQFEQLQDFLAGEYDVLCVNIVNRESAANIIDLAKDKDIPLVFFNREPVTIDMMRWNKVYYVGCDAGQSGQLQAEMVVDFWRNNYTADKNSDGIMQCVILNGEPDHQDTILRTENNLKVFNESDIPVEILASYTANWQRDQAQLKIEASLEAFENSIEVIISNNDEMALGAINALKEFGYYKDDKTMPVFGIDATPVAIESLMNNELAGTVLNDGINQARGVIDIAVAVALGEDINQAFPQMDRGRYYWVPYKKINKKDIQAE